MLEAMKAMAQRSVMERLVLFVNHVVSAESAAVERLRPHAGKAMKIELGEWPSMLPSLGPFSFRVTPAGLVEWQDGAGAEAIADLRVTIAAANPAALLGRLASGERPSISVSGDAAFASDIDWLIDHLRWDVEGDLARFVGDAPARELGRFGSLVAGAFRDASRALRDLAARSGMGGAGGAGPEPPRR